jgi:AbrB family looped-hinge helix DNA binding protein
MEYVLKVSPKGQVTLPKKLRETLKVNDLIEIEVKNHEGIVKKPEGATDALAGCFHKYAMKKRITLEKAVEKAAEMVAREIAQKDN